MTLGNGLVMANTLKDIASGQDNSVEGVLLSGSPNDTLNLYRNGSP